MPPVNHLVNILETCLSKINLNSTVHLLLFQSAGDPAASFPEQAAATHSEGSREERKMQFHTMQTEKV